MKHRSRTGKCYTTYNEAVFTCLIIFPISVVMSVYVTRVHSTNMSSLVILQINNIGTLIDISNKQYITLDR